MNKFVVLVLDSFGVGAMEDVPQVRPNDIGADTCGHILQQCPDLRLPAMERLGLINSLGYRANVMEPNPQANVGKAALQHEGADSFMGHQEIMGTQPKQPSECRLAKSWMKRPTPCERRATGYSGSR